MRIGFISLVFMLTISLSPSHSATPIKSGSVCAKQGNTKTYNGKKFTCIKTRNKLVWKQIVSSKKSTTTSLPSKPPEPNNLGNFSRPSSLKQLNEFSAWRFAHREVRSHIEKLSPSNQRIELVASSAIPVDLKTEILFQYKLGLDAFSDTYFPKLPIYVVVGYGDETKFWKDIYQYLGSNRYSIHQETATRREPIPGGEESLFLFQNQLRPFHTIFMPRSWGAKEYEYTRQGGIHGFVHSWQTFMTPNESGWIEESCDARNNCSKRILLPQMFVEGHATFMEYVIFYPVNQEFVMRKKFADNLRNHVGSQTKPFRNEQDVVDFFISQEDAGNSESFQRAIYAFGAIANEALVAVYGYQTLLDFFADIKRSVAWREAFKNRFGITPIEFYGQIAPYLLSVQKLEWNI